MLDRAEDPEKLIKLMIREMEDTLVELKASCANTIASQKKVGRIICDIKDKEDFWESKAQLAVDRGRDDLARQALKEKKGYSRRLETMETEVAELDAIVEQYRDDIQALEDKLKTAREKQRMLVQRHIRASRKKKVHEEIRRADSAEIIQKFDEMENHIEQMEAEADLINYGKKGSLEEAFEDLVMDDEIEAELSELKSSTVQENDEKIS
jgi:phage shock protein A